jgi:hypothetical protein
MKTRTAAVRESRRIRAGITTAAHAERSANGSPGLALPGFRWEDKTAIYRAVGAEKGQVQTVKVTLIGLPGRIVESRIS